MAARATLDRRLIARAARAIVFLLSASQASWAQFTARASVTPSGAPGNADSSSPSISASGRYVAFASAATDLLPGAAPTFDQIYVFDSQSGAMERESTGFGGVPGNGASGAPWISADGRYVAFLSRATNLVAVPVNGKTQVFVRDRQSGLIDLVSINQAGQQSSQDCDSPSLSGEGRLVVFATRGNNLVPAYSGSGTQIYLRDRQAWTTSLLSIAPNLAPGNDDSAHPIISTNGRFVSFSSEANNLVTGDTNSTSDVFVLDRVTNALERASKGEGGVQANSWSDSGSVSDDGLIVAFKSAATNLVAGFPPPPPSSGVYHVFARHRDTGAVEWLSRPQPGTCNDPGAIYPMVSPNGRAVAFLSESNLDGCCPNSQALFLRDLIAQTTARVDFSSNEAPLGLGSVYGMTPWPALSADGGVIAFITAADPESSYGTTQVMARSLAGCAPGKWIGPYGGQFHSGGNWCGGAAPGFQSQVRFTDDLISAVSFLTNPVADSALFTAGQTTLSLAGHTLTLLSEGEDALRVSASCPRVARLTVHAGQVFARGGIEVAWSYPLQYAANGELIVDGPGAAAISAGELRLGFVGFSPDPITAAIRVLNGGTLRAHTAFLDTGGLLEVAGAGSLADLQTANESYGADIAVRDGGLLRAQADRGFAPALLFNGGTALVSGAGAALEVGDAGVGTATMLGALRVENGGRLTAGVFSTSLPPNYYGEIEADVAVVGAGARLEAQTLADIGTTQHTTLLVSDGGRIAAPLVDLGPQTDVRGAGGGFEGHVRNAALVLPGDTVAAPGVGALSVAGDLEHTPFGVFLFDLGPAGADNVTVTGAVTLEGGLVVLAPPDFDPPANASWEILSAASVIGEFGFVSLPPIRSPKFLQLEMTPTAARIRVLDHCVGDANGDGIVDFLDLNIVLGQYGQQGSGLPGDVNGDGIVDFLDLNGVLSYFGISC